MPETIWSRRRFLRTGALGAVGVAAAACSAGTTTADRSPSRSPASPPTGPASSSPEPTLRTLAWRRLGAEGPAARRDHAFAGFEDGALLFGGSRRSEPMNDLWFYANGDWSELSGDGPSPRFGLNAIVTDGSLIVFGGQGRGNEFFNDAWRYDIDARRWRQLQPKGSAPAKRYGASSVAHGTDLIVSHGFTFQGRFDDTRSLRSDPPRWRDLTPSGTKPFERCLHRAALLEATNTMLLFGGQTTGTPYLGDTWLFDFAEGEWRKMPGDGPSPRNLYAMIGVEGQAYLFGGLASRGALRDTWLFDGAAWRELSPEGDPPPGRGGVEGALTAGGTMLVFGGSDGSGELDDLWELTLPG